MLVPYNVAFIISKRFEKYFTTTIIYLLVYIRFPHEYISFTVHLQLRLGSLSAEQLIVTYN